MREEDIRPRSLMAQKKLALDTDIQFLVKRKSEWVEVDCPACGSDNFSPDGSKAGFDYRKCAHCETVFSSPRPDFTLLADFYQNSANYEFWNRVIFPSTETIRKQMIYEPRAKMVTEILLEAGLKNIRLCEVGAAYGWFLEAVRSQGVARKLMAIEPSQSLAQTCEDKGFETIPLPLESVDLTKSVEVMAAFEVLEHVFSPLVFLERILELLSPGGMVFLSCPNVKGFDLEILGYESGTFQHEHLNYFHPSSIKLLLARAGFEDVQVRTPGLLDVDIVHSAIVEGSLEPSRLPWLGAFLLGSNIAQREALQSLLREQEASSHMFVFARKPS